jgi:hypothetical protein
MFSRHFFLFKSAIPVFRETSSHFFSETLSHFHGSALDLLSIYDIYIHILRKRLLILCIISLL